MDVADNWQPSARVEALARIMVELPSVTGSDDEASFAEKLRPTLTAIPYFAAHPEHVMLVDSHGSPPRKNIVLLVKGQGRKTLCLAGHYDTVSIENYRDLAPLACKPDALKAALLTDLRSRPLDAREAKALDDLESGEFLPGRAMLDMKSGDAAGLAVLERFSEMDNRIGNLILCMVPDEEGGSAGIRALRSFLPELAERFDLDIEAAINLDATSDQNDGADGRAIHLGSIGKYMPFAMVLGRPTHAAYPFEGISAHFIAAEIMQAIEANPDLADIAGDEPCPPPACLEMKDLRETYDVTMPDRVFMAFNWLSFSWSAEHLLTRFSGLVADGLERAVARYTAMSIGQPGGGKPQPLSPVMTIDQLRALAASRGGAGFAERFGHYAERLQDIANPLEATRKMTAFLMEEASLEGPLAIIGFASLHYPAVRVLPDQDDHQAFLAAIEQARVSTEMRDRTTIRYRDCFMGISDMSFLGHRPDRHQADLIASNTPLPHLVDVADEKALSFPCVNIGPWGREYHQRLERIHRGYGFDILPKFLMRIVQAYLR